MGAAVVAAIATIMGALITGVISSSNTDKTNATNKEVAEQNLDFQRENLDYQKGLQEQIFDREDTSYQRTVEDMRNAGLNPLTMNGTNASGEAIATTPLNNDYKAESYKDMSAYKDTLVNAFNEMNNAKKAESELKGMDEENRSKKAQADIDEANAKIAEAEAKQKIRGMKLDNETKRLLLNDQARQDLFNEQFGTFNGMSEQERLARFLRMTDENNPALLDKRQYSFDKDGKLILNRTSSGRNYESQKEFARQMKNLMQADILQTGGIKGLMANKLLEMIMNIDNNTTFKF